MKFDLSDVEPARSAPRRRRSTTAIPLDEADMLEPACEWRPQRTAAGTWPPPPPAASLDRERAAFDEISTADGTPLAIEEE